MATQTQAEIDAAKAKGSADAHAEAEKNKQDETVPGGEYIVNDIKVDSEGEPIGSKKKKAE